MLEVVTFYNYYQINSKHRQAYDGGNGDHAPTGSTQNKLVKF